MNKPKVKEPSLTKEVLSRAVSKGIRKATETAIETAGSLVEEKDGWVVRRYKDGSIERLKQLPKVSSRDIKKKVARLACQ